MRWTAPVFVGAIELRLYGEMSQMEPHERGAVIALLVGLAFAQRRGEPFGDLRRNDHLANDTGKQPREIFLAHVGVAAPAAMAGATVVRVPPLLGLGGHRTPTATAGHQPCKCVLAALVARAVYRAEHFLYVLEQLPGHQRLMLPPVLLPVPHEVAVVDRIVQDPLDLRLRDLRTEAGCVRPAVNAFSVTAFSDASPRAYHSNSFVTSGPRTGSTSIRCVSRLFTYPTLANRLAFTQHQ